jgi:hypothetical protein
MSSAILFRNVLRGREVKGGKNPQIVDKKQRHSSFSLYPDWSALPKGKFTTDPTELLTKTCLRPENPIRHRSAE